MPIIAPKPEKLRCREHSARTRNSLVIKFRCSTPSDIVDIVPDDRSSNVAFSVITMYRSIATLVGNSPPLSFRVDLPCLDPCGPVSA